MLNRLARNLTLWLGCSGLACSWIGTITSQAVHAESPVESPIAKLATDLQFLSSDELAGRDVGSEGISQAGAFIAARFTELGLKVDSFDGSPYQEFTIPGPATLGPREENTLQFSGVANLPALQLEQDFTPVSLGNSGAFSGEVVFAGYGITAPDLDYDDYSGLDVAGKVVIILRKEPGQNDPKSKFDGQRPSQYAYFSTKELNASVHQAAALIIVNDRGTVADAGSDQLPPVTGAGSAGTSAQLPTLYCLRSTVEPIIRAATGKTLDELESAIELETKPHSHAMNGISAAGKTQIAQSQTPVRNVIGLLPGRGDLAEQYLVIGAHYDHVGMGGVGSLAPGTIEVHNGADDNASGTTVLLDVARRLASDHSESRRGIIFVAFTAEERGLLGSKHYVRHPRWPLEETVAMLNMDMVGRLAGNNLTVYGTGTAAEFDGLVDRLSPATGLSIDKQPAGFGPSDHASFYEHDIPVLHFFTGLHNDYHRPSDDAEKANVAGMLSISELVVALATEIATLPARPTLVKSSAVAKIVGQPPVRAALGIRLAIAAQPARIAEVFPGSAANRAGLLRGDVITAIDATAIDGIQALRAKLAEHEPGDVVSISVRRGAEILQLSLTLQAG